MQADLKPFDTLFFRDGKPFSLGEEVWAGGMFPPPPSVVYGALRTAFFGQQPDALRQMLNGGDDPTADLQIHKLLVRKEGKFLFPAPYDVVMEKGGEKEDRVLNVLKMGDAPKYSSYFLPKVLYADPEKQVESLGGKGYLPAHRLKRYLGRGQAGEFVENEKVWVREPKIGITKSRATGSAEDTMLYRVDMVRPQEKVGLYVDFSHLQISDAGFVRLGGEGKATTLESTSPAFSSPDPPDIGDSKRFKIYLATPAKFIHGWQPGIQNVFNVNGLRLSILAAAVGRPVYLGGFDMKLSRPKAMMRAVPAGSVYYVEAENASAAQAAMQAIHGNCISDEGKDEGFGLAFCGKIN